MSDLTAEPKSRRAQPRRHAAPPRGLPLWASPLVVLGGALIGVLADISSGQLGVSYIICFGIAAVIATIIVEPRGLTVTVLQQPLLFYVVTPLLGWISNRLTSPGIDGFAPTRSLVSELLRMMYPLISLFPWVLAIFTVCCVIAVLRYLAVVKQDRRIAAAHRRYLRRQERSRMTTQSATRARAAASERDRANLRRHGMRREDDSTARVMQTQKTEAAAGEVAWDSGAQASAQKEEGPRTERGEAVLGAGVRKADSPRRHRRKGQQRRSGAERLESTHRSGVPARGTSRNGSTKRGSAPQRTDSQRMASDFGASKRYAAQRQDAPPAFDRAEIERERQRRREAARRREVARQTQPDVDRGFSR